MAEHGQQEPFQSTLQAQRHSDGEKRLQRMCDRYRKNLEWNLKALLMTALERQAPSAAKWIKIMAWLMTA